MSSKATIVDVAKECGLSQATVARVLNGQKEIQVKDIADIVAENLAAN